MSENSNNTKSPFLIKKITDKLDILEVTVRAKAIKKRKIHLLEWALLAPLSELDDPVPTLEEIASEFGIEKVDFLEHTANSLTTLGVLNQMYANTYSITDMGQRLYRKGEMVSDPRDISVPIYYEPSSKEWFTGAKDIEAREFISRQDKYPINQWDFPEIVPEKALKKHVAALKILEKEESLEDHSISEYQIKITDVDMNIFLKNDGLDLSIIKNPLGEKYNDILKETFKEQLIQGGGLKRHLKDYEDAVAEFTDIPIKQYHKLDGVKLYSSLHKDMNLIVNEMLRSKQKWLINSNESVIAYISTHKTKPEITVHIKKNSTLSIQTSSSQTIPTYLEVFVPHHQFKIPHGNIISESAVASISLIEANEYKLPLYTLEQVNDATSYENKIYTLFNLSEGDPRSRFYAKVGKFILKPEERLFNEILESCPTIEIRDTVSSKKTLKEISDLRGVLKVFDAKIISDAPVYKAILNHLNLSDLVSLDVDTIFHCRKLYVERLNRLVEKQDNAIKNPTWKSISNEITSIKSSYEHVTALDNRIRGKKNELSAEMLDQISIILSKFDGMVEQYISQLPAPSKRSDVEELYNSINKFSPPLKQKYLKVIKTQLEEHSNELDDNECLEIYKLLNKHGNQPKESTLKALANAKLKDVTLNLLDSRFSIQLISIQKDFSSFETIFNIRSLIEKELPESVEKASGKNEVQILVDNLFSLRKAGILNTSYVRQILLQEYDNLRSSTNSEDVPIAVFLLATTGRRFTKEKLLDIPAVEIWNYTHPFLIKNKNVRKKMEGDLSFLGLKEYLQKLDESKSNADLKSATNEESNKGQPVVDTPPIKRIIIDGSNVAREGYQNGKGSIKQLIQAYNDLKNKYGFEDVSIIIGAGLRHHVTDFDELKPFIEQKIALQAPAGVSDDKFIIDTAIENNLLILTNDMYKEFRGNKPLYATEIQRRRVAYMIDPGTGSFRVQFPLFKE